MINLKDLRKESGKRQSEIAKLLGVTQQTYANYENGRTEASYETLVKLANIFNLTVDEMLEKNSVKTNKPLINLIELRKAKGKTQRDIANLTGYMQTLVSKWENGEREPDCKTLITLANYFNVSIDYLIGNSEEKNIHSVSEKKYTNAQQRCIDIITTLPDNILAKAEAYLNGLVDMEEFVLRKI